MKLVIEKITKSYGTTLALSQFTTELESGIYALLGPNGSGKSTLMNIITDNLKADSGQITYTDSTEKNEDVIKMGVRFREKLGFMPQYPGMYPNFTVERFMWYMAALKGIDKKTAETQIHEILNAVELSDSTRKKIGALSGGMKQRLCLAQAVLGNPEILILDEPTAGLDPKQRIAIRNYISKIAFNKIVIFATHVVSDIEYIADRIIILKKGEIVNCAPPTELTQAISRIAWRVPCHEKDVANMQERFSVVNISKSDSGVNLRVLSDVKPTDESVNVTPTLEDYYLHVFGTVSSEA